MRLIDADALYEAMQDAEELARKRVRDTESTLPYPNNLNPAYTRYLAQMDERTKAKKMVADAPTVDAAPVVHGRWQLISSTYDRIPCEKRYWCSKCHHETITHGSEPWERFCPNCGAKMDGKEDGSHEQRGEKAQKGTGAGAPEAEDQGPGAQL